jgi:hypothetical protein
MKHGIATEVAGGTRTPGSASSINRPEYLRLPRAGTRCPVTGLTRTALNELILPTAANGYRPPVRSFSLKRPGQIRGVRLISLADLVRHIEANRG